jgi:uncharacterized damage-inducible protein DinB
LPRRGASRIVSHAGQTPPEVTARSRVMGAPDLPLLYEYAVWANERVLSAAETLTPEQWQAPLGHSFDSVHGTMVHILSSEMLWLGRWQGQSPTERGVSIDSVPTVADLRARWAPVRIALHFFDSQLDEVDWARDIAYRTLEGVPAAYPLWQMYLQVINHGTHHRAEASDMLTALGAPPLPLDMIVYFKELRQRDGA